MCQYNLLSIFVGKQNESEKSTRLNVVERYIFCGSDDDEKELTSRKLEVLFVIVFFRKRNETLKIRLK
jgi:hypothetical protein